MSSSLMTFAVFAFFAARDWRAASATDCAGCDCESCARAGKENAKRAAQAPASATAAYVWILCGMVVPRFAAARLKRCNAKAQNTPAPRGGQSVRRTAVRMRHRRNQGGVSLFLSVLADPPVHPGRAIGQNARGQSASKQR